MDAKAAQTSTRMRFLKLSLKKNRLKTQDDMEKVNGISDIIVLDESSDRIKSEMTKSTKPVHILYSPIVINDSCEVSSDMELPVVTLSSEHSTPRSRTPSRSGNVSFNGSGSDNSVTEYNLNRPSAGETWSPAQNIICATPRNLTIPSTPKDVANESVEECTMKKIQQSQKKLLDDLYGEVWKSVPNLFKTFPKQNTNCLDGIARQLAFDDDDNDDDDSDKENVKDLHTNIKKQYLTGSDAKKKVILNDKEEKRSKKKLYTEKVPNTPEPKQLAKRREVNTTSKKPKGKTITEMVNNMTDVDCIEKSLKKVKLTTDINTCEVTRLTFMGSLADNVPKWRCHVEAVLYRDKFKANREQLTRRLFIEFNTRVFEDALDSDLPVTWDSKLRSTAGTTTNRLIKSANGSRLRSSSIKLSTKVVDRPQRLRDTLIHELCHAATWLIDQELRGAHGPLWRKWAAKALAAIPELGEISRCHNLEIHYKYTYKCTQCGYCIHRHSKSIDTTKKCCGYCRGAFSLVVNRRGPLGGVTSAPPAAPPTPGQFAASVQQHYGTHRREGATHAHVMRTLAQEFSARKKQRETENREEVVVSN